MHALDAALATVKKLRILLSLPETDGAFAGPVGTQEPANKKALKQARFFSAKRKRKTKDDSKTLTKPSKAARMANQQALLQGPTGSDDDFEASIPNINSVDANLDHRY